MHQVSWKVCQRLTKILQTTTTRAMTAVITATIIIMVMTTIADISITADGAANNTTLFWTNRTIFLNGSGLCSPWFPESRHCDCWWPAAYLVHMHQLHSCWRIYMIKSLSSLTYRQISNIRRINSQNLNVSCLALQLSFPNPLTPGVG